MIRRLVLQNWRAYESADVGFDPGTTFVVARNGIGKTSLLEAAQFALTGEWQHLHSPVQIGADSAVVELTLQLPRAQVLRIRRELFADRSKQPALAVFGTDGEQSASQLAVDVEARLGAPIEFIGRNAFVADIANKGAVLDLRALLARAFGLDAKRAEARRLAELAAQREEEAKQLGRRVRAEAKAAGHLEAEKAAADEEADAAARRVDEVRARFEELKASRDDFLHHEQQRQRRAQWEQTRDDVLAAARTLVSDVTPDSLTSAVEELAAVQEGEVARLRAADTSLRTRLDLVHGALEELQGAGAECPVCLRPLDVEQRQRADELHRRELERLRSQLDAIDIASGEANVQAAKALLRRVDALGPPPTMPAPTEEVSDDPQAAFDEVRAALEAAIAEHRDAVAAAAGVGRALAEAAELEKETAASVTAWRRWAITATAAEALRDAVDAVLSEEVEPLVVKVGERWNALFPDRPELRFNLDGELWREIRGHRLRLPAFSSGEQMAAQLLMQLAILTTATSAEFCWIDEPLEHLDPKTRRLVAGMLSRGRMALGLRQLVVTTYEDELAERLADADELTTVQHVRAGFTA